MDSVIRTYFTKGHCQIFVCVIAQCCDVKWSLEGVAVETEECKHTCNLSIFVRQRNFKNFKLYAGKVRMFATIIASRQNSVNQYWGLKSNFGWRILLIEMAYLVFWLVILLIEMA